MTDPIVLAHRGSHPRIAPGAWIAPGAAVIGEVEIGADASVWFGCVVRGDVCDVTIGARTNLQDGTIVHVTHTGIPARIGSDVTVGHACVLHACTVEDGAFVGMRATVMDEAVIESGGMLAAGALLAPGKRVRSGELWGGVPARFLRKLRPEEVAVWPERVAHYVELAQSYREAEAARRGGSPSRA